MSPLWIMGYSRMMGMTKGIFTMPQLLFIVVVTVLHYDIARANSPIQIQLDSVILNHSQNSDPSLTSAPNEFRNESPLELKVTTSLGNSFLKENISNYQEWTTDEISKYSSQSLGEFLEKQGLMQIRQTGGAGSPMSLNIRGLDLRYTQISINGVLQSSSSNPQNILQNIPTETIERIKIHYLSPSQQGISSHGGSLIEITLKDTSSQWFKARYGSYEEKLISSQISKGDSVSSWSIFYQGQHAQNNYPYPNNNGTNYNSEDDYESLRSNNHIQGHQLNFENRFAGDKFQLNQLLNLLHWHRGLPGFGQSQAHDSYFQEDKYSYQAQLHNNTNWSMLFSHWYRQDHMYWTREDAIYYSPGPESNWKNEQRNTQAQIAKSIHWTTNHSTQLASHYQFESQTPIQQSRGINPLNLEYNWKRHFLQFSLGQSWRTEHLGVSFQLQPLYIRDFNNDSDFEEYNWNAQLSQELYLTPHWRLNTGLARHLQVVSTQDKYGLAAGLLPNPELENETLFKAFIALNHQERKTNFNLNAFYTLLKDRIIYSETYNLARAENELDLTNLGLDSRYSQEIFSFKDYSTLIEAQLLIQFPRLIGELQNYKENLPANISPLTSSLTLHQNIFNLQLSQQARFYHAHYSDNANKQFINHQIWLDTWIQYRYQQLLLQIGIDNWTETQDQRIYNPLPVPGRRWHLQATYTFGL